MVKCLQIAAGVAVSRFFPSWLILMLLLPLGSVQAQENGALGTTVNLRLTNGKQHCVACTILSETKKGNYLVKGRVLGNLGQPVKGASVLVQELRKVATSDSLGYFCFLSDIPTDTLHVTAHFAGYIGHEMTFLPGQKEITVRLQQEPADRLPDVMVIGSYGGIIVCRRPVAFITPLSAYTSFNDPLTGKLPAIHFTPIVSVDDTGIKGRIY